MNQKATTPFVLLAALALGSSVPLEVALETGGDGNGRAQNEQT
jgi:hypothetical protein